MKHIILGIKDYCRDCWHDFILREAIRYGWNVRDAIGYYKNGRVKFIGVPVWKEGSMWHYIQQRKIAKNIKQNRYKNV